MLETLLRVLSIWIGVSFGSAAVWVALCYAAPRFAAAMATLSKRRNRNDMVAGHLKAYELL